MKTKPLTRNREERPGIYKAWARWGLALLGLLACTAAGALAAAATSDPGFNPDASSTVSTLAVQAEGKIMGNWR